MYVYGGAVTLSISQILRRWLEFGTNALGTIQTAVDCVDDVVDVGLRLEMGLIGGSDPCSPWRMHIEEAIPTCLSDGVSSTSHRTSKFMLVHDNNAIFSIKEASIDF